ncbi:Shr3 amino acid permease chaperone [Trametes cingulata]|nr:Shr3 amino acid permease chaperone [Trametes cingulata]
MGYRQAAVLTSVSFFLGVLFICLNVDYRILFTPFTEGTARDGIEFYTTFYNSPPAIKALLHSIMGVGLLGLVGKLHKWDDSAMFFDGSSLAAYIFALAVYLTVGIPACRTVADPVPDVDTKDDQIEALRILSAGNTIIIVLLGAILALQAGEQWARRIEANILQQAAEEQQQQKPATTVEADTESKKDK